MSDIFGANDWSCSLLLAFVSRSVRGCILVVEKSQNEPDNKINKTQQACRQYWAVGPWPPDFTSGTPRTVYSKEIKYSQMLYL